MGTCSQPLALLVEPGTPTALLRSCLNACQQSNPASPCIVSQDPGPIRLDGGLRILANEVLPKAQRHAVLVLAIRPESISAITLAYVQGTLDGGGAVFWYGEQLCQRLGELPLKPGQVVQLLRASEAQSVLTQAISQTTSESPN